MSEYDEWDPDEYEAWVEQEDQCDYGWGLCMDPELRDMGCCFECDLMLEQTRAAMEASQR